ncbi:hypothetical protein [Occallatibacter savannae]|uniref:hypothetical protein n=1 Tax=Occallatibacter savannae TaxID=1002691 RepID=UPI000D69629D|nr:hypothetical protein [Occallatibacter savannae]
MAESALAGALTAALEDPESAEKKIREVSMEPVVTVKEAELVVRLLRMFPLSADSAAKRAVGSSLRDVIGMMQRPKGEEAVKLLREAGCPELLRIFDTLSATADKRTRDDLLFLLKVVSMYAPQGGLNRVVTAARSPLLNDGFPWSMIFHMLAKDRHPWRAEIIEALREPLPEGFVAITFLDLCNAAGRSGGLKHHPFDTESGLEMLLSWVRETGDRSSHALSAAASIPFLSPRVRGEVQTLANQHPDRGVQLEAAWAAAACGDERGFQKLEAASAVPQDAAAAMHYLTELGAENRIPPQSRTDDFKAISEMCQWLGHPNEFGAPPEEIQQVDARELFWPPKDDRRKLWVFRYRYPPDEGKTEPKMGYGMVGSVTFALFGEATADLSPEQVFGLHCAWELECNGDPRAPKKRTPEAGVEILKRYNPDFG